ncbi:MAG: SLC13 family permease [Kiritimatiellae bacterium]|nr:SLC13 family permease [Kiritimatiellia bacterium]
MVAISRRPSAARHAPRPMLTTLTLLSWQAWLTITVILAIFILQVFTRLPADFTFLGALGVLLLSGVLNVNEALAGFSAAGMITVGLLYVVVAGVQGTGGLNWVVKSVLGTPKTVSSAQLRMMLPVAGLSLFLNNTPVVALFIPIVKRWAKAIRISPSKLMIPLSYASIFGGVCTLIGTSTNVIVNGMYHDRYGQSLTMFGIAALGVPCLVAGIAYMVLFSKKLLPEHRGLAVAFENAREYTTEFIVEPAGAIAGRTITNACLRNLTNGFLVEIVRGNRLITAPPPSWVLQGDDRLVFAGGVDLVHELREFVGLQVADEQIFELDAPLRDRCLVECVVSNTCPLIGKSIREGRFRNLYNAGVLAVARNGARLSGKIGDITLQPGDTLLVEAHAGFVPRQKDSRDFYLISGIDDSAPVDKRKAPLAFLIVFLMVALVAAGVTSMLKAAMAAAFLMLVCGCCSFGHARRSVEWNVLLVVASALGIGLALQRSGAAEALANGLLTLCGSSPWPALACISFVTIVLTAFITNNAAAALMFPVAINTVERLNVSVLPFVFCLMVAASCSFASPIGYQTNLMVYGPGGYRFSDYMKIGIPLSLLLLAISVGLAPLIWPF